jgi:hypothetical protein
MTEKIWKLGRAILRNGESVLHGEITNLGSIWFDFDVDGVEDRWTAYKSEWTPEYPQTPLPTEPGSVIRNATIRGEAGHTAMLSECDYDPWMSVRKAGGTYSHSDEDITYWEVDV